MACSIALRSLSQRSLDGQFIARKPIAIEGGALGRQIANKARMHAHVVHQARHFDTASVRQVCDQPAVDNVAVEAIRFIGLHGVDDADGVLIAALDLDRPIPMRLFPQALILLGDGLFPARHAAYMQPDACSRPALIAETFDQFGASAEVGTYSELCVLDSVRK